MDRRQLCWAHLIRNLLALAERDGALGAWAADLLAQIEVLFAVWHAFRAGRIDREALAAYVQPLQVTMRALLEQGQRRYDQAQGLGDELVRLSPALWTFVSVEGVEPTNNFMERLVRLAVLWRRRSFGCNSAAGCRFVERILTVVQTCRLRDRNILEYLTQAVQEHRCGRAYANLFAQG